MRGFVDDHRAGFVSGNPLEVESASRSLAGEHAVKCKTMDRRAGGNESGEHSGCSRHRLDRDPIFDGGADERESGIADKRSTGIGNQGDLPSFSKQGNGGVDAFVFYSLVDALSELRPNPVAGEHPRCRSCVLRKDEVDRAEGAQGSQ